MNDCPRSARPMRAELLAETTWICWIRRMVDRRRVEGDLVPQQITIKSAGGGARRGPVRATDGYSCRNGKQTCQFLGVFACKSRLRGGCRACQGEHRRQGQSDGPMAISLVARGFFAGGVREAAPRPWILLRMGGSRAQIPYCGEYCRPIPIVPHRRAPP